MNLEKEYKLFLQWLLREIKQYPDFKKEIKTAFENYCKEQNEIVDIDLCDFIQNIIDTDNKNNQAYLILNVCNNLNVKYIGRLFYINGCYDGDSYSLKDLAFLFNYNFIFMQKYDLFLDDDKIIDGYIFENFNADNYSIEELKKFYQFFYVDMNDSERKMYIRNHNKILEKIKEKISKE